MPSSRSSSASSNVTLALILLAGAALRFYHLGTPSLWWDEMLVPLTSAHSLGYIVDFCRSAEMHPPLFYFISKAGLALGPGDLALRLLPALLGTGSIYVLYRIVRGFSGEDTALLAAALLAVNGLHLLLSREIRPYALQIVLLLAAWKLIVRLSEEARWRDLAWLCCVNTALFWLHYFTFHMVFAQGLILAACLFARTSPVDFRRFATFCAFMAAMALPVFIWFFLPSSGSRSILTFTHYSRWDVLKLIVDYLGQAVFFFDAPWARGAAATLALAGFASLIWLRPRLAAICLILATVPLENVLAIGKAAYFSPWHAAYVVPFLAFFSAQALAYLPGRKLLAASIAVGGAIFILSTQQARYYAVDSYKHNVFVTLYKPVAEQLAGLLSPEAVTVASNPGFANGVGWYLDQFDAPSPLRSQSLGPEGSVATLKFISAYHDFGVLGRDEASFLAKQGQPESIENALNATVYTFRFGRQPITRIEGLPSEINFSAGLREFYGHVYDLKNVRVCPMPGVGVTATRNGDPGSFEFALDNAAGNTPMTFFVDLQYLNIGKNNVLGLYYRFDDEPRVPLAGSRGMDPMRQLKASFNRDQPFGRLIFTVELNCQGTTPMYHGGNLETLAFRSMDLFACPSADAAASQAVWERRYIESLRLNYTSEVFLSRSSTPHTPDWKSPSNMSDTPSHEVEGWNVLAPIDPAAPAVLTVEIDPRESTVFYPRLSGSDASVQVFDVQPDGSCRPVFMMAGVPDEWTPISAQYPLALSDGPVRRLLRIELRGRFCQLWHKGGSVFF